MTAAQSRVEVPGASLYLRRTVARPGAATLLAVHGGPGISHEPLAALEELASDDLSVAIYDQRGTGQSSGAPDGARFIDETVDDLAVVARAAAPSGRVHLLGHSWGGLPAALYAARHPERVASLILVDSIPPTAGALEAAMVNYRQRLREFQARGLVPAELPSWPEDAEGRMLAIFPIYFVDPCHAAARSLHGARLSGPAYQASQRALSSYDVRDEVARIRQPALHFIAPVPFGPAMATGMADALGTSRGRRVNLQDTGHLPFLERPAPFLAEVARFIGEAS